MSNISRDLHILDCEAFDLLMQEDLMHKTQATSQQCDTHSQQWCTDHIYTVQVLSDGGLVYTTARAFWRTYKRETKTSV